MAHIQAGDISLAYGDRDILKGVNLTLTSGDRCALAGANGSGKSTLMRILALELPPDSGSVVATTGARIVYLPQSGITHAGQTLDEEIELAYGPIAALLAKRDHIAEQMQAPDRSAPDLDALVHEHHEIQERIERSGYYDRDAQIDRILSGLGFARSDRSRGVDEFSGGWQMRIALAKVLLSGPDFLLLDEPTNYLDVEARVWLGSFLSSYAGGVLIVSHDRRFLDQTIDTVWELFLAEVRRYRGSYSDYERQREEEIARLTAAWEQQQEEIRRIEDFIRRFRAKASKARQVQSRIKQLEKMEPIVIPEHLKRISIAFPPAPRSGREVVTLESVSRRYGTNRVLEDVDLIVERGEKVALVGPNGAGKSTLMRIIAGTDSAHGGTVRFGAQAATGFYADDDSWLAGVGEAVGAAGSPARGASGAAASVFEVTIRSAHGQTEQQIRNMLGAFLFRDDDVYKSIDVLSGGERSRLAMLQLLLQPHNLLVLDEPTNHLDMASKDVLLDALRQFKGTIVFVSHDREFIEKLAGRVIELRPDPRDPGAPSLVSDFPGDYHYYAWRLEHQGETVESGPTRAGGGSHLPGPDGSDGSNGGGPPEVSHGEQKARRSRRRQLERRVETLLEQIAFEEQRHETLQRELADPSVYGDGAEVKRRTAELKRIEARIDEFTREWESAATELESQAVAGG